MSFVKVHGKHCPLHFIWTIIRLSLKQNIKAPSFWIIMCFFSFFLALGKAFSLFTFDFDIDHFLLFSNSLLFGMVVIFSSYSRPEAVLNPMVLSKPVPRGAVFIGKYLGSLASVATGMAFLFLFFLLLSYLRHDFPVKSPFLTRVLACFILPFLQISLLYSFFLFFALFCPPKTAVFLSIFLFLLGGLANFLLTPLIKEVKGGIIFLLLRILFYLVPNFGELDNISSSFGHEENTFQLLFFSFAHIILLTALILWVNILLQKAKDF